MSHIALVIDQTLSPSTTQRFVIDVNNIVGLAEIDLPGKPAERVVVGSMTCPVSGLTHGIVGPSTLPVQPRTVVLVSYVSSADDAIRQVYVMNSFDEVADIKIFG